MKWFYLHFKFKFNTLKIKKKHVGRLVKYEFFTANISYIHQSLLKFLMTSK